jgi:hypothetical protein
MKDDEMQVYKRDDVLSPVYTTDRLGFQGAWTTVPDRGLRLLIGGGGIPEDAQRRRTVNRGILRCGVGT